MFQLEIQLANARVGVKTQFWRNTDLEEALPTSKQKMLGILLLGLLILKMSNPSASSCPQHPYLPHRALHLLVPAQVKKLAHTYPRFLSYSIKVGIKPISGALPFRLS